MAANEALLARVRRALGEKLPVEEKKMFGSIAFMVRGHMCVAVGPNRMMVRVDPERHDEIVRESVHCTTMVMKNREYKGYIRVDLAGLTTKKDLDRFLKLALDYNRRLEARPGRAART
ncbi:MAG: TfoX/Sxy family protein [Acidobacteriaceae bacterium]|nr:TfoX/Sxy family protein [Acidobacteriaceae bacterium]